MQECKNQYGEFLKTIFGTVFMSSNALSEVLYTKVYQVFNILAATFGATRGAPG